MTNKKIAILINSLDGGGAERVVSTLLNNFIGTYECYLILMEDKTIYDIDDRIKVINLNEGLNQNGVIKLFRIPILAFKLIKIIRKYKFTQIISFLYRANYVNVIAKYISSHKVVLSERIAPSSMYSDRSITSKASKYLIKLLYPKADLIIPVSEAIKNDLINNFNIKVKQKVIYNPYDIENINKLSQEFVSSKIEKDKSIITVGSLGKRKNHTLLIQAFSKIEDKTYKLYLLGDGIEKENLKRLTQKLNIEKRVIFLGFDKNPYKYLSKCSIFVLSSNSEGFPNVLAEAMVCGCSVISTDCLSGPREILAPNSDIGYILKDDIEFAEYGILTPVKNEEKLKKAIELMIIDKDMKKKYSKKAKERANDFAIQKILKQYRDVICAE